MLAGGRSSEHDISLASARSVLAALDPARYETRRSTSADGRQWQLGRIERRELGDGASTSVEIVPVAGSNAAVDLAGVDVVLPILHGPFGEDGTVQGLLELLGLPYVGAGVAASALCMDKDLFKAVLRDRGIPVARNVTVRDGDPVHHPFSYPVFVKPARLGSSVGISKVHDEDELDGAVALARRHDDKVLIEEFVAGTEVECGVLGNRDPVASVGGRDRRPRRVVRLCGEVRRRRDGSRRPRPHLAGGGEEVRRLAVESFVATECEGMARIDFFVRPDDEVVVNEINTIPGFTATSVYAKLFEASGIPYARAARPPDRARARAARAPLSASCTRGRRASLSVWAACQSRPSAANALLRLERSSSSSRATPRARSAKGSMNGSGRSEPGPRASIAS